VTNKRTYKVLSRNPTGPTSAILVCRLAWMLLSVRMDGQFVTPLATFRPWVRVNRYI